MKKICYKCSNELDINKFYQDKSKSDGYRKECIECNKLSKRLYYEKKKEHIKSKVAEYRNDNREAIIEKAKLRYSNNKEKYSTYNKQYRERNKDIKKENNKQYYLKNKDKIISRYVINRESELLRMKGWKKKNRPKLAAYQREYYKKRRQVDPIFKLRDNVRSLFQQCFRRNNHRKTSKTIDILGFSIEEFKLYIESKFESWMSWNNYGLYNGIANYGWDIDHIIPISKAITVEDVIRLNHYTNLQPLCSHINRDVKKGNSYFLGE